MRCGKSARHPTHPNYALDKLNIQPSDVIFADVVAPGTHSGVEKLFVGRSFEEHMREDSTKVQVKFRLPLQDLISARKAFNDAKRRQLQFWVAIYKGVSKYMFENAFQLWLQSSFFALSFHFTTDEAKYKQLLSLGLGLGTLLMKSLPVVGDLLTSKAKERNEPIENAKVYETIPAVVSILFGVWSLAKVVMAYKCDTHLWNLTTGCVAEAVATLES